MTARGLLLVCGWVVLASATVFATKPKTTPLSVLQMDVQLHDAEFDKLRDKLRVLKDAQVRLAIHTYQLQHPMRHGNGVLDGFIWQWWHFVGVALFFIILLVMCIDLCIYRSWWIGKREGIKKFFLFKMVKPRAESASNIEAADYTQLARHWKEPMNIKRELMHMLIYPGVLGAFLEQMMVGIAPLVNQGNEGGVSFFKLFLTILTEEHFLLGLFIIIYFILDFLGSYLAARKEEYSLPDFLADVLISGSLLVAFTALNITGFNNAQNQPINMEWIIGSIMMVLFILVLYNGGKWWVFCGNRLENKNIKIESADLSVLRIIYALNTCINFLALVLLIALCWYCCLHGGLADYHSHNDMEYDVLIMIIVLLSLIMLRKLLIRRNRPSQHGVPSSIALLTGCYEKATNGNDSVANTIKKAADDAVQAAKSAEATAESAKGAKASEDAAKKSAEEASASATIAKTAADSITKPSDK